MGFKVQPVADEPTSEVVQLRFEEVPCPCCGNDRRILIARPLSHHRWLPGVYSYVRCKDCHQIYLNPRLDSASLGKCYARLSGWNRVEPAALDGSRGGLRELWHRLIGDEMPAMNFVGEQPVLDVGSNEGEFLSALRARGVACEGLEFNPEAVARCRQRGLTVHQGDLDSVELAAGRYGTITLVHTLEHLADPVGSLSRLRKALRLGGRIVIVVPHVESPMRSLFGPYWQGWDPPFHLAHYDAASIRKVATLAGLRLDKTKVLGSVEDVRRSVNLRVGRQSRRLLLRVAVLPVVKFAELFGLGAVLICVLSPA